MRLKPDPDPEFLSLPQPKLRHRTFRSLRRLMAIIALSGLVLAGYSRRLPLAPTAPGAGKAALVPTIPVVLWQPPNVAAGDPSVVVAPWGIDESMIVTAGTEIDRAMIVTPERIHH